MAGCSCCGQEGGLLTCVCGRAVYCDVRCQRSAWQEHRLHCPTVAQVQVQGKGAALVATRRIRKGQAIVLEEPLLNFPGKDIDLFLETFAQLPQEKKLQYLSLYDPGPSSSSMDGVDDLEGMVRNFFSGRESALILAGLAAWRILWANGVTVGLVGQQKVKAVYPTVSRINHSCAPNAVFGLVGEGFTMAITAVREITRNEEISLNYIGTEEGGLLASRQERRRLLAASWKFLCQCRICSLEGEQRRRNEALREKLRGYREELAGFVCPDLEHVSLALELSLQRVARLRELGEEVLPGLPGAFMDCYGQARAVSHYGGQPKVSPAVLEAEAVSVASHLGPSLQHIVMVAKQEADQLVDSWEAAKSLKMKT